MKTDVIIAGTGCSGLYLALSLPRDKQILLISKSDLESNDSYLAQGGMCTLKDMSDYDSFFEDTMKAGHYENDKKSVEIMIKSSPDVLKDCIACGADFHKKEDGSLDYTKEGAHSSPRIVFHEDETGKEITSHLLMAVKKLPNVKLCEYTTLIDIIEKDNVCLGAVLADKDGKVFKVNADVVALATGGIGGLYEHSTNFKHLTGDALAIAINHNVELKDIDYIQIHPTTFYSENPEDRSFLISESARGEGAKLYDKNYERFTNELLPRDLLTKEILKQMEKDGTKHVWEDLSKIPAKELKSHFPNITAHCKEQGYDCFNECIPVVPAQHYFMGGVKVNYESKTSMENLYVVGEAACNGVHGKNRLASNSLLESLVFAKRAAIDMVENPGPKKSASDVEYFEAADLSKYDDLKALEENYKKIILEAIKLAEETRAKEN